MAEEVCTGNGTYIKDGKVVDAHGKERAGWTIENGVATPPQEKKPEESTDTKGKK